jgi:hypothetical protein
MTLVPSAVVKVVNKLPNVPIRLPMPTVGGVLIGADGTLVAMPSGIAWAEVGVITFAVPAETATAISVAAMSMTGPGDCVPKPAQGQQQQQRVHSVYADGTRVYEGQQPPRLGSPTSSFDPAANGAPHSVLRWDWVNNRVYQAREFGQGNVPLRDIDFTNPTFPNGTMRPGHPGPPHQHPWQPVDPNNPAAGYWRDRNPIPYP